MASDLKTRRVLWVGVLIALAGCGSGSDDAGSSASGSAPYPGVPDNGRVGGELNFAKLISRYSEGKVSRTPWAGSWWPYSQGGIGDTAVKLDAAGGGGGAASWEMQHHGAGLPGLQSWWGHCNGWAAAATLFAEPREPVSAGGEVFTAADRKAALSEIAMEVTGDFFGRRAEGASGAAFEDVYPNQFFLVLTNYVGQGFPLIIDRYTGDQVWNQPLAGYRIDPVSADDDLGSLSSAPNIHRIMVTTTIWWLRDDVAGGHLTEPFAFADGPSYESRTLRYELWLDGPPETGNVVLARDGSSVTGGAWRNGGLPAVNSHPDYMWVAHGVAASSGFSNPAVNASWVEQRLSR